MKINFNKEENSLKNCILRLWKNQTEDKSIHFHLPIPKRTTTSNCIFSRVICDEWLQKPKPGIY